jgi:hypothetical protein
MFRIKTDIRQYKCDTQDKVEKLIRNWVIRPNDLIFSADDNGWHPIGQHPAFVKLFGILDEQIRNEPDTVVTHEVAGRPVVNGVVAHDVAAQPAHDETVVTATAAPEEVTRIEVSPFEAQQEEAIPAPPEPPEGIEPSLRRSDEITMMTERTADLLGESAVVEATPEEHTEIFGRSELGLEAGIEPSSSAIDLDEDARPVGRHDLPEDFFATAELSGPIDRNSLDPPIDELGALSEGDESEEQTQVTDSPLDQTNQIVVKDEDAGDDELRATNELTLDELQSIAVARGEAAQDLDDTGLVIAEAVSTQDELLAEVQEPPAEDAAAEPAAVADELASGEVSSLEETTADIRGEYEHGEAFDDDFDEEEQAAQPSASEQPSHQNLDFVSDGYALPLPFDVKPTAEHIAMGLKQTRVPKSVKDRSFPAPAPKKPRQVQVRRFDFTEEQPRDQSLALVGAVVVALIVVIGIVTFLVL